MSTVEYSDPLPNPNDNPWSLHITYNRPLNLTSNSNFSTADLLLKVYVLYGGNNCR
jgi:hypothetical protein